MNMRFAGVVTRFLGLLALAVMAVPAAAQQKAPAKPAAAGPATAQGSAARLAFVDSRRILMATPGWTAAEQAFAKERTAFTSEMQRLQASLDSAAQDFEQQSVVLSPTQRQAKRTELDAKRQQLEQRAQELQQKAQQRQSELLAPLETRVNSVIDSVRSEGNYAFIFDVSAGNSGIIAADRTLDLTDRVIGRIKGAN
jgi:outer membrane protein